MSKRRLIVYEGKAKILYEGPEPGTLIQHFKDDITAFNNEKHEKLDGKGAINNRICEYIFNHFNNMDIPTHFIKRLNMREQLIHEIDMIPLEVVVRNLAAGSLAKRLGLEEGKKLPRAIVEFYYKSDELGDPFVSEDHIKVFEWATAAEIDDMVILALRANDLMSGLFYSAGIKLVDFKLEFGRLWKDDRDSFKIVIADEVTPDSCRLWDVESGKKLDKDRFRHDLDDVIEAYNEIAMRLRIVSEQSTIKGFNPVVVK